MTYHEKDMWICDKCGAHFHDKPEACALCKGTLFSEESVEHHKDHPHIKEKMDEAMNTLEEYEKDVPKRSTKTAFEE